MARASVIGAGYVGLTAAVCLAHLGHDVVCGDLDAAKIEQLGQGRVPIEERGVEDLLRAGLASGRLRLVTSAPDAVDDGEFHFLCLPTPQAGDGSVDLSIVESVVDEITPLLPAGSVVVTKSTVAVGTADRIAARMRRADWPTLITTTRSAETIKYACNAFLATKLSFVNSIATFCEAVDADIDSVVAGMGGDRRIGPSFLSPGPGWGGSCFPKDVRALARLGEGAGSPLVLLDAVVAANDAQLEHTANKVLAAARGGAPAGVDPVVAGWGLTFKAGTGDLRESPAIEVLRRLAAAGVVVRGSDPS